MIRAPRDKSKMRTKALKVGRKVLWKDERDSGTQPRTEITRQRMQPKPKT